MISLLFILFNLVFLFSPNKALTHPEPKIWISEGHILFPPFLPRQQFLEYNWEQQLQPYQGKIIIGGAYSLVLEMPTFGRWDVLVESCTCNGVFQFLQGGGCLRRDNFWLNRNEWRSETNKYMVVHFVAPQSLLKFDCQTLVVKCCGCCDNACGRLPSLESFPSLAMTISCQYPLPIPPSPPLLPPPVLPPSTGGYSSGCWMPFLWGDYCSNGYTPFWLIPLFLCLLALLLILCCLLALCIYWAFKRRREQGRIFPERKEERKEELQEPPPQLPPLPSPPPPIPKERKIFSTDQSAQTTPISPLSPSKIITESGIDYFDKSRRNQINSGFERFEHHAALPIIPTSPWYSWTREEEEIEEREEEWRMEDEGRRNKYRQSFNNFRHPPPPYREGNRQQQQYYG
uniref:ZP domain-containing protein n=1 Tax=Meloidogyne hapla TaxID=6305 RepID=A0A1I8BUT0_MELHA